MLTTTTELRNSRPIHEAIDPPEESQYDKVSNILDGFHADPAFINYCESYGIDERDLYACANAYGAYIDEFCQVQGDLISDDAAQLLKVGGQFASAMYTSDEIIRLRQQGAWTGEQRSLHDDILMPQIIAYNHYVSEYLYQHPETKIADLEQFMYGVSRDFVDTRHDDAAQLHARVKETIKGARTEAIVRRTLEAIGIAYRVGTVAEERKGGDIVILWRGHEVLVDVKSSLGGLANSSDREYIEALADAGKLYIVTGKDTIKLLSSVDRIGERGTAKPPADPAVLEIFGAQIREACNAAIRA